MYKDLKSAFARVRGKGVPMFTAKQGWRLNESAEFRIPPFSWVVGARKWGTPLTILTVLILVIATVILGIVSLGLRIERAKVKPARGDKYSRTDLVIARDDKVRELYIKLFGQVKDSNNKDIDNINHIVFGKMKGSKAQGGVDIMDDPMDKSKTKTNIFKLKKKMGEGKVGLGKDETTMIKYVIESPKGETLQAVKEIDNQNQIDKDDWRSSIRASGQTPRADDWNKTNACGPDNAETRWNTEKNKCEVRNLGNVQNDVCNFGPEWTGDSTDSTRGIKINCEHTITP